VVARLHHAADVRARGRAAHAALSSGAAWCHGDARANNIYVAAAGQLRLIDWECSGSGAPELDLGAFAGSLLAEEIYAAAALPGNATAVRHNLNAGIAKAGVAIRQFLEGYAAHAAAPPAEPLMATSTGACLICRAYAKTLFGSFDRVAAVLLEAGIALIMDPRRWRAIMGPAQ
jgi:aminoglycoside phosphotransferase (APT) family kinase protein